MIKIIDCHNDAFVCVSSKKILAEVVETARSSGCSDEIIARLQNEGGLVINDLLRAATYLHQLSRFKIFIEFRQDGYCEIDFAAQVPLDRPPHKEAELLDGPWTRPGMYWKKRGFTMGRHLFPIKKSILKHLDWIQYAYHGHPKPDRSL